MSLTGTGRIRTIHVTVKFDVLTTLDRKKYSNAARALSLKSRIRTRLNEIGVRIRKGSVKIEAEEL